MPHFVSIFAFVSLPIIRRNRLPFRLRGLDMPHLFYLYLRSFRYRVFVFVISIAVFVFAYSLPIAIFVSLFYIGVSPSTYLGS